MPVVTASLHLGSPRVTGTCHFFIDNTEFPPETPQAQREDAARERLLSAMIGYAMGESCLRARCFATLARMPRR